MKIISNPLKMLTQIVDLVERGNLVIVHPAVKLVNLDPRFGR